MPAIFSRLSLWFAAVFAALLVVRAASGGLGLSARALRSLQLCLLLFCGHRGSGADSAREFERAQYGRCGFTNLRLRNLDWSAERRFWQSMTERS